MPVRTESVEGLLRCGPDKLMKVVCLYFLDYLFPPFLGHFTTLEKNEKKKDPCCTAQKYNVSLFFVDG